MYRILLAVMIFWSGNCDEFQNGWKGIKPLESNKAFVEKLLGKPEVNDDGFHSYRTDDAFIRVSYTTARCKKLDIFPDRGQFDVEPGTVLYYAVNIKKRLFLSDFVIDRKNYVLETDAHLEGLSYLINEDEGIRITISTQQAIDYLAGLDFDRSKENLNKYKCSELANLP
jgi:hypothetical protein